MLRLIYRWRYRRAQKAGAFKLPPSHRSGGNGRVDLGSYLSQASVRGRGFDRFDLPSKRRKGLAILIALSLAILVGWVVLESIAAIAILQN